MRSTLSVFVLVFVIANIVKAQPTITSAEVALPGDILAYPSTKVAGIATPAMGANITWDYSALIDSGEIEIDTFVVPSATPYASLFPGSNLALIAGPGMVAYYQTNASNWSTIGFIIADEKDTAYYSKPFSNVHFPFSYGSTFTDSADFIIAGAGYRDTVREITLQHATGYGTLKIPGHTYSNVLAINLQTTQRYEFGSYTSTSIVFFTPGVHSYVMEIDLDDENEVTDIRYRKTGVVVVPDYTFNGNGNWNNSANWSGNTIPPSPVPSGAQVTISPQAGGSCILNIPVTFSPGAKLTVTTGAAFKILGSLTINN